MSARLQTSADERLACQSETRKKPDRACRRLEHDRPGQHSHFDPQRIIRRVTDYGFWIHQAISKFHPLSVFQYALLPLHYLHHYGDPTAFHLAILWENRECGMFKTVESFRFDDGRAFDFRGVADRSVGGRKGILADSNERAFKGFAPTYWSARDYRGLAGRFNLGWFFVKAFIAQPRGKQQNCFFAPERGVTMRDLNGVVPDRISDHPPLALESPLSVQPGSQ